MCGRLILPEFDCYLTNEVQKRLLSARERLKFLKILKRQELFFVLNYYRTKCAARKMQPDSTEEGKHEG